MKRVIVSSVGYDGKLHHLGCYVLDDVIQENRLDIAMRWVNEKTLFHLGRCVWDCGFTSEDSDAASIAEDDDIEWLNFDYPDGYPQAPIAAPSALDPEMDRVLRDYYARLRR